jgi:alanyl-tRNA synthetase
MKTDEIRTSFLDFFKEARHKELASSPLPIDEPSLLFTVAGMVPLKKYFLGEDTPSNPRMTSAQRCLRTNDIEEVGKTSRHQTFFEMLGNFSVGDYFKKEAIDYAWEFLTSRLSIDKKLLWATVYPEDTDAFDHWKKLLPENRIIQDKDNFWKMAETGPSGFDSEIYFDRGPGDACPNPNCNPLCPCGRYTEIWNLVFMEFNLDANGKRTLLPQKNIDTGMGLERLSALMQGARSNFGTDLFVPLIDQIQHLSGKKEADDVRRFRLIADHARALVFLAADGVFPENQKHGYVLRRLLRRAKLAGYQLGIRENFLWSLSQTVIQLMQGHYRYLVKAKDKIQLIVSQEETQFQDTLEDGFRLFHEERERTTQIFSGKAAFKLHDTFGFPVELTRELLEDFQLKLNDKEFDQCLQEQRNRGKKSKTFQSLLNETEFWVDLKKHTGASIFLGYEKENESSLIKAIIYQDQSVEKADKPGESYLMVLDQTPFYPEKGGPMGDKGAFSTDTSVFNVEQTISPIEQLIIHRGVLTKGSLKVGDTISASVDHLFRKAIRRAHTATHLLHVALKELVGDYVNQAGSWIEPDYFRFDFNALRPLGDSEILQLEDMVNTTISKGIYVCAQDMSFEEAMDEGATALFKEKYGEQVRVVSIENISRELCGGIHTQNTCEIRLFRIISESSIGSNLRRIEAVVGDRAIESFRADALELKAIEYLLKKPNLKPIEAVSQLHEEIKKSNENEKKLQERLLRLSSDEWLQKAVQINHISWITGTSKEYSIDQLKMLADILRQKTASSALLLLFDVSKNPSNLILASSKDIDAKKIWQQMQSEFKLKGGGPPHLITGTGISHDMISEIQHWTSTLLHEISVSGQ